MTKQAELPGIVHRCMWCRRPLYRKESIAKRMGPKCEKMDREVLTPLMNATCQRTLAGHKNC